MTPYPSSVFRALLASITVPFQRQYMLLAAAMSFLVLWTAVTLFIALGAVGGRYVMASLDAQMLVQRVLTNFTFFSSSSASQAIAEWTRHSETLIQPALALFIPLALAYSYQMMSGLGTALSLKRQSRGLIVRVALILVGPFLNLFFLFFLCLLPILYALSTLFIHDEIAQNIILSGKIWSTCGLIITFLALCYTVAPRWMRFRPAVFAGLFYATGIHGLSMGILWGLDEIQTESPSWKIAIIPFVCFLWVYTSNMLLLAASTYVRMRTVGQPPNERIDRRDVSSQIEEDNNLDAEEDNHDDEPPQSTPSQVYGSEIG
ncbi:hypothetical protein [Desulfovibrio inopinatus]|uniref:hypothetical protein n=1 Tax=Desulfovibrio inopinatus TaxID=102109 RepID=UPI0003FBC231|nr:hypothetical protein [Desulfovibrio inopinatus]